MSFSLIRGSQDTASEGFAYQPTSFQLCILYIYIYIDRYVRVCVCVCVGTLMPEKYIYYKM